MLVYSTSERLSQMWIIRCFFFKVFLINTYYSTHVLFIKIKDSFKFNNLFASPLGFRSINRLVCIHLTKNSLKNTEYYEYEMILVFVN